MDSRVITLTPAAYKYGNLNIRLCGKEFFPPDVFGRSSRAKGLGVPITLKVKGLTNAIKTDIPTDGITGKPRWLFRERKWLKEFVQHNGLRAGIRSESNGFPEERTRLTSVTTTKARTEGVSVKRHSIRTCFLRLQETA
jgi:hypothetical protein